MLQEPHNATYFQNFREKPVIDILPPLREINIMSISDSKIESKVISLKVLSQLNEGEQRQSYIGYAVRPAETFFFEESSMLSGESPIMMISDDPPASPPPLE